mgnify:CR=1 FL=1
MQRNRIRHLPVVCADKICGLVSIRDILQLRMESLEAREMLASGKTMVNNINQGKGTLGKLATDDELHRRLNSAISNLDGVLTGIRNGDGTLGKLFKDPTLYSNLNNVSTEMKELMGDFRRDPKKFLTIQLKIF